MEGTGKGREAKGKGKGTMGEPRGNFANIQNLGFGTNDFRQSVFDEGLLRGLGSLVRRFPE